MRRSRGPAEGAPLPSPTSSARPAALHSGDIGSVGVQLSCRSWLPLQLSLSFAGGSRSDRPTAQLHVWHETAPMVVSANPCVLHHIAKHMSVIVQARLLGHRVVDAVVVVIVGGGFEHCAMRPRLPQHPEMFESLGRAQICET